MNEENSKTNEGSNRDGNNRFLSFSLGGEDFAIPLLSVKEVIALPEVTPVPYTPPHFLGIMNLRGQVISVIDLRKKLDIKPGSSVETSVIICDLESMCIGMVVDSINSVLSPSPSEMSPKPDIQSNKASDYITGVYRKDRHLVLILDATKLVGSVDRSTAAGAARQKSA